MLDAWIHSDFKAVDKRDPLQRMQGYMEGTTRTRPIICDGKRPYGVPNRKAMMSHRLLPRTKAGKYALPVPVLLANADHYKVLEAMAQNQVEYLPVMRDGKLAGYVEALDLLDMYDNGPTALEAAERVAPLREDTSMGQALKAFGRTDADSLPVFDDHGAITGVLHRNMALRLESQTPQSIRQSEVAPDRHDLTRDAVRNYMSSDWAEAPRDASFADLRDLLHGNDHVFVPTLRDNGAAADTCGIVTVVSMVRACHRQVNRPNEVMSPLGESMSPRTRRGHVPSPDHGHLPS